MNLTSIAARLREKAVALKQVGGATDLATAQRNLVVSPAAFVMPSRDMPNANAFGNQLVEQVVPTEFAVVLVIKNVSDPRGMAAIDALEPVRVAVRDALLNWTPEGAEMGCEYGGGELVDFRDGVLWWTDAYRTQYTIRSTA